MVAVSSRCGPGWCVSPPSASQCHYWQAEPSAVVTGTAAAAGTPSLAAPACPDAHVAAFGPNVCVFTDTMSQAAIQNDLDNIATQQVPVASQFTSRDSPSSSEPGTYGSAADPLVFQVGYYTEVAGLGAMPTDTVINGAIDVFNNLCTPGPMTATSDDNFWRSLSNVTLNVHLRLRPGVLASGGRCVRRGMRQHRRDVVGIPGRARSGAPSSTAASSSRTTAPTTTSRAAGSSPTAPSAAPSTSTATSRTWSATAPSAERTDARTDCGTWSTRASRALRRQCSAVNVSRTPCSPSSPVTEEEPFLYTDAQGNYDVFVPAVQHDSTGPGWAGGDQRGHIDPAQPVLRCHTRTPPPRRWTAAGGPRPRPDPHPRCLQPRPADRGHPFRHRRPRARASPHLSRSTALRPWSLSRTPG